jgi:hypothetical protein
VRLGQCPSRKKNSGQAFYHRAKQQRLKRSIERRWSVGQRYQETKKKDEKAQTPQAVGQNTPSETKGQIMCAAQRFSLITKSHRPPEKKRPVAFFAGNTGLTRATP